MAVSFSSRDEDIICRKISVDFLTNTRPPATDLLDFFEIDRCVQWINVNSFSRVALQFPDNLLGDATEITLALKDRIKGQLFVLGDTTYGSCCVDEIAAEHISASAIIHYGHACLSPTNRLPVLYIFGKFPININNTCTEFKRLFENKAKVVILYEVPYSFAVKDLKEHLGNEYSNLVFSELDILVNAPDYTKTENQSNLEQFRVFRNGGRILHMPKSEALSSYSMFYIGSGSQTLLNFMLTFNNCRFFSYNPSVQTGREETLDTNRYLRKRYYCIEKAKDSKIIGILVGTLGVSKYLDIISHLRTLIKKVGKKSYVLVVGKLSVAKLANFQEIDVFVCVACPESSLIDSHEFYKPIVTPFEMEVACNQARAWTGDYITDFSKLLPGAASFVPLANSQECGDVSLITGKMRFLTQKSETIDGSETELVPRDKMAVASVHSNGAGEYLVERNWHGLQQMLGETPVAEITRGKKGIASRYEGENESS